MREWVPLSTEVSAFIVVWRCDDVHGPSLTGPVKLFYDGYIRPTCCVSPTFILHFLFLILKPVVLLDAPQPFVSFRLPQCSYSNKYSTQWIILSKCLHTLVISCLMKTISWASGFGCILWKGDECSVFDYLNYLNFVTLLLHWRHIRSHSFVNYSPFF